MGDGSGPLEAHQGPQDLPGHSGTGTSGHYGQRAGEAVDQPEGPLQSQSTMGRGRDGGGAPAGGAQGSELTCGWEGQWVEMELLGGQECHGQALTSSHRPF